MASNQSVGGELELTTKEDFKAFIDEHRAQTEPDYAPEPSNGEAAADVTESGTPEVTHQAVVKDVNVPEGSQRQVPADEKQPDAAENTEDDLAWAKPDTRALAARYGITEDELADFGSERAVRAAVRRMDLASRQRELQAQAAYQAQREAEEAWRKQQEGVERPLTLQERAAKVKAVDFGPEMNELVDALVGGFDQTQQQLQAAHQQIARTNALIEMSHKSQFLELVDGENDSIDSEHKKMLFGDRDNLTDEQMGRLNEVYREFGNLTRQQEQAILVAQARGRMPEVIKSPREIFRAALNRTHGTELAKLSRQSQAKAMVAMSNRRMGTSATKSRITETSPGMRRNDDETKANLLQVFEDLKHT